METHVPVSVLKFGGTSVGSGERIRRVATIVAHTLHDESEAFPVVVVSAMSGITDQLLRIARHACSGKHEECERELASLRQKHLEAADKVVHDLNARHNLRNELETSFVHLEQDVAALMSLVLTRSAQPVATIEAQSDDSQDISLRTAAVAAWGERLSTLLVAAACCDIGTQAAPVRGEVIITSHPHSDLPQPFGVVVGADPLPELTRESAQRQIYPLIEQKIVPIAAGFLGRTTTGFVTTLGRNGSDYSATVIGAALDCVEVTIYTDVDGVLTADPRLVSNTRLLSRLTYAEAARLSWFGAKVLHPRTLIPIAHLNIPVRVRNSFQPHVRGTVVGPDSVQTSGATGITIRRHLALVTVESTDLFGAPENAGQVFELAARAGAAPVAICSSSGHHLSFMVEEQAVDSVVSLLQHDMGEWRVRTRRGLAACVLGVFGFGVDPMSPARAVAALAREHIPLITQGSSELGITLIVEDRDSERALRCLHRDLIAPVIPMVRHAPHEKKRGAL